MKFSYSTNPTNGAESSQFSVGLLRLTISDRTICNQLKGGYSVVIDDNVFKMAARKHRVCAFWPASLQNPGEIAEFEKAFFEAREISFEFPYLDASRPPLRIPVSYVAPHKQASSGANQQSAKAQNETKKATSKTAATAGPSYDISKLPPELLNAAPVKFAPGEKKKQTAEFLYDHGGSPYIDKACYEAAYPYLRAANYWRRMDDTLKVVNQSNPVGEADLSRETADQVCADPSAKEKFRGSLAHHPANQFDGLCTLIGEGRSGTFATVNIYTGSTTNICFDTDYIAADAHKSCMQGQHRTQLKTPGLAFSEYCGCVGDRKAKYFAGGKLAMSSSNLTLAGSTALRACDGDHSVYSQQELEWIGDVPTTSMQKGKNAGDDTADGEDEQGVDEQINSLKKKGVEELRKKFKVPF